MSRISYANVTATLALFVALGGTSYATYQISGDQVRDGSLTGRDIREGSVSTRELRNGTVRSSDLRNGTILSRDIQDDVVRSRDIRDGIIRGRDILDGQISGADVKNGSLDLRDLSASAIDELRRTDARRPADELADGAVSTAKLADGAVTTSKLAPGALPAAKAERIDAARVASSVPLAVPHNDPAVVAFDQERLDNAQMHEGSASRVIVRRAGLYALSASVEWDGNPTGTREIDLLASGQVVAAQRTPAAGAAVPLFQSVTALVDLQAGDYVQLRAYQNSGSPLNVNVASAFSPSLSVVRLGDI